MIFDCLAWDVSGAIKYSLGTGFLEKAMFLRIKAPLELLLAWLWWVGLKVLLVQDPVSDTASSSCFREKE